MVQIFKAAWPGSDDHNLPPVVVPGVPNVQICTLLGPNMLEGKKYVEKILVLPIIIA